MLIILLRVVLLCREAINRLWNSESTCSTMANFYDKWSKEDNAPIKYELSIARPVYSCHISAFIQSDSGTVSLHDSDLKREYRP